MMLGGQPDMTNLIHLVHYMGLYMKQDMDCMNKEGREIQIFNQLVLLMDWEYTKVKVAYGKIKQVDQKNFVNGHFPHGKNTFLSK